MRLFLSVIFMSVAMLAQSQSENPKVTISFQNVSVSDALAQLNNETPYRFAYNSSELEGNMISLKFTEKPLAYILENILPSRYSFNVSNKLVIIFKVNENSPSKSSATRFNFNVRGSVKDLRNNEPLPFAYIYVPSKNISTETDEFGNFSIQNMPNDTCLITVEYIGYQSTRYYLNPEMDMDQLTIYLSNVNFINEANVSPDDVPILISSNSEINQINYLKNKQISNLGESDALSMLKYLSGFNAAADGEQAYSFHGLKPDENSYILDGTNVLNPSHFFGLISSINSLSIKNIRVHNGGYSSEFGGRAGALAEITTSDGNSKKPEFLIKAGLLGISAKANSSILNEKGSFSIASRRSYSPIFKSGLYDPLLNSVMNSNISLAGDNTGLNVSDSDVNASALFSDTYGKLSLNLSRSLQLKLSGYFNDDLSSINYSTLIPNNELQLSYDTEIFWRNFGGAASLSYQASPKLNFTSTTSGTDFLNSSNSIQVNSDLVVNESQTLQSSKQLTINGFNHKTKAEFNASDSLQFMAGIELDRTLISRDFSSFGAIVEQDSNQPNWWSGFLQSRWHTGRFSAKMGYRLSGFNGTNFHSPRIRLTADIGTSTFLSLRYGKHYQFLRKIIPLNLFTGNIDQWAFSNDEIPFLLNEVYALNIQKKLQNMTVSGELNFNNQSNVIESTASLFQGASAVTSDFQDLYTGNYKGFSANISAQYNKDNQSLSANYSFMESNGEFNIRNEMHSFRNPRVSRHNFSFLWFWKNDRFNASSSVIYSSGKPVTPTLGSYVVDVPNGSFRPFFVFGKINSNNTPSFLRIDLSAGYKFHLKRNSYLEVDFALQNILNKSNLKFQSQTFLETANPSEFTILQREIYYLGRAPSVFFSLSF